MKPDRQLNRIRVVALITYLVEHLKTKVNMVDRVIVPRLTGIEVEQRLPDCIAIRPMTQSLPGGFKTQFCCLPVQNR
jgi:hypothetical protein